MAFASGDRIDGHWGRWPCYACRLRSWGCARVICFSRSSFHRATGVSDRAVLDGRRDRAAAAQTGLAPPSRLGHDRDGCRGHRGRRVHRPVPEVRRPGSRRCRLDAPTSRYGLTSIALIALWLVALAATRSRLLRNTGTGMVEYQRVLQSTLFTFGAFAVVAYLFQLQPARGYLAHRAAPGARAADRRARRVAHVSARAAARRTVHDGRDRRRRAGRRAPRRLAAAQPLPHRLSRDRGEHARLAARRSGRAIDARCCRSCRSTRSRGSRRIAGRVPSSWRGACPAAMKRSGSSDGSSRTRRSS